MLPVKRRVRQIGMKAFTCCEHAAAHAHVDGLHSYHLGSTREHCRCCLYVLRHYEDEGHSGPVATPGVVVLLSKGRLLLCSEPAICPLSQTLMPILHIAQDIYAGEPLATIQQAEISAGTKAGAPLWRGHRGVGRELTQCWPCIA